MGGRHRHRFVDDYEGMIAFGLSRQQDESSLIAFVQKFADDDLMALLAPRLADDEILALVDHLTQLLRSHLSEAEYHRYFLKD